MRLSAGRPLRRRLAILLAAAAVGTLATSCASGAPARHKASQGDVVLTLNHMSTLKSLFNEANGHPRLVLILSPT